MQQIYLRHLPGGGTVTIRVSEVRTVLGKRRYRGDVVVERRADLERRIGHEPPVVAHVERALVASVLHELFPIAQSNAVVAMRCIQHYAAVATES